jgi:hypothetical protein
MTNNDVELGGGMMELRHATYTTDPLLKENHQSSVVRFTFFYLFNPFPSSLLILYISIIVRIYLVPL